MKPSAQTGKKPINFRLTRQAVLLLTMLEKKLHTSKTAVVEKALQYYADQKLKFDNPVMQYAGIFSEKDANEMLVPIKNDRCNKKLKTKL
jgi:hypothetical protein